MPMDKADLKALPPYRPNDLLYGLDTGQIKYRTYFRKKYYPKDTDAQHKIDYYTAGLGPNPGSPLPQNWDAANAAQDPSRKEFRGFLQKGSAAHPFDNRYDPKHAAEGAQWNARFRRTSKAGLQWALLVKHWNVHFILNELDMRDVVAKQTLDEKGKPKKSGSSAGPYDSRRITYCELRWLYRHRNFPLVKQNVQFWRYDLNKSNEFLPVLAPWLLDPKLWGSYKPKLQHISQDYDLAELGAEVAPVDEPAQPVAVQGKPSGLGQRLGKFEAPPAKPQPQAPAAKPSGTPGKLVIPKIFR